MKTTFYKKLVPLAMIASLALSGAGSAMAGTGFLTYNGNSIVAFADDEDAETPAKSTAAVDLSFTSVVNPTGEFDYLDDADKVRSMTVEYKFQENYTIYVQNSYSNVSVRNGEAGTPLPNKTIKEYTKDNASVWIYSTDNFANGFECEYVAGDDVWQYDVNASVSLASGYSPVENTPAIVQRSLGAEGAKKVADIKPEDFVFSKEETKTVDGKQITSLNPIAGMKVTEIKQKTEKNGDEDVNVADTYLLTVDVPAGLATNTAVKLVYGGLVEDKGGFTYTKQTKDVVTKIENNVITEYTGDAKNIDLAGVPSTVTGIGADAFKKTGIQNVIVSSNIKTIAEGAFSECESLETVTIDHELTSVGANAFPKNTVVILGDNLDTTKNMLESANANVFVAKDAKPGEMLVPAGDTIKFNCVKGSIISTGSAPQTAKLVFNSTTPDEGETAKQYTFGTPGANEEQIPSTYKWVLATTAGKASSAAKIGGKSQLTGATSFDIDKTKANGKFNNTVVLMAVSTSKTKDYNIDEAYAYCKFYIKPATVTEWNNSSKGTTFVAGTEPDKTKPPVQKTTDDGKKWWIQQFESGVNQDPNTGDSALKFESWEQVAAARYTETDDVEKAWVHDGKPVIAPATDTKGNVQYEQTPSQTSFDLTITEGQSFSLPIKAKNGADKTLKYEVGEGSECFTVVNGKVKGITAGEGIIVVSPVDSNATVEPVTVYVHVTPKVSKGITNTASLTLVGTDAQSFRIGANPVSAKDLYYTISENEKLNITSANGAAETIGSGENAAKYYRLEDGADVITVSQKKADDGISTAKTSLDIQYYEMKEDGTMSQVGNGKKFTVKVNETKTGEYDNVKKFKETAGKLDKANNVRKLSVPTNVTTYLGLSVTPATANQNFITTVIDKDGDEVDGLMKGDAFTASTPGVYKVRTESVGVGADGNTVNATDYLITVYDQGGSIVFNDDNFDVIGGFLIKTENAKTDSEHTFAPGEELTFNAPKNDAEDITWTSNNPAGLAVNVAANGKMTVIGLQPGTYTVTGKSANTAQKYTFKVIVDKKYTYGTAVTDAEVSMLSNVAEATALEKGETVQLGLNVPKGVAGTVKWETEDKTLATVSGKGLVKVVNKANEANKTCKITATMTLNDKDGKKDKEKTVKATYTVSLKQASVTVTPKPVPAAAKAGIPFKVSATVKNIKASEVTWTSNPAGISVADGKATFAAKGTYEVFANGVSAGTVVVSAVTPTKLAVVDGPTGQLSIKDLKNKKVGLQNANAKAGDYDVNKKATVYVKATTDRDDTAADAGDIIWTSSNAKAVTAKTITEGTKNSEYATVEVIVNPDTKYVGKVTLTGVSVNGGKKVSFVVMVNDGATADAETVKAPAAPATPDTPAANS